MPEDERELRVGEFAIEDVQVGTADTAGMNAQKYFAGRGLRVGQVAEPERLADGVEHHGSHRAILALGTNRDALDTAP